MKDSLAERAGVEPDTAWPRTSHRPAPPLERPAVPSPTPPPGRDAHNAAIIDRIVADKVRDAQLLRCIVQGCYRKAPGDACAYCGTVRG